MSRLDHLLWSAPVLEDGIDLIERLTGVRAAPGGRHPGRGTHNALLSLGEDCYLEIIAPDPEQELEANLGARLSARAMPGIFAFAICTDDLTGLGKTARDAGIPFRGPEDWSRKQPDGPELFWQLGFADETEYGDHLPLFIDWKETTHPARTTPGGLSLKLFEVMHPDREGLSDIYETLGIDLPVLRADRPAFRAILSGPRGELVLTS
ncbi:VOC family protein [Afifella sp. IM 167]|uniref:VOC family protein n=1 Tax=Afifella sp. IM 167 TaxID=2033586 RepID=UPI001CCC5956|nr:VOC family protein [Afifella sp. IM 167]MBZ8134353.1 hypothetical protein [Afifella sp. IM 167]